MLLNFMKICLANVELFHACRQTSGPVTVAKRSKACTIFVRSEAAIVGSNSTQGMDV
jgi:hypothetical protein